MAIIKVPKPPKSAYNEDRPISTLLRSQIEHLQEAEFRLPVREQTNIYINAIKTEGEAAEYIRQVTERLHQAHAAKHGKKPTRAGKVAAIAAMRESGKRTSRPTKNKGKKRAQTKTRSKKRAQRR